MRLMLAALVVLAANTSRADEHVITVYSRAQPGAIDPRVFEAQIQNPDHRQQVPGHAVIRTRRDMVLDSGTHWVRFHDVAAGIDPTTVTFTSRTDPEHTQVLEQNYRYDLVSTARILDRYLGQTITVDQVRGDETIRVSGELLAARDGDLILRQPDGGLVSLGGGGHNIRFPELPEGLITRPTLEWLVAARRGGDHAVQVAYETLGMTWWTDYNATYREADACQLDLNAWVSLVNQSGGSFEDASLKLIAGEVNRIPRDRDRYPQAQRMERRVVAESAQADGFSEKAFFEYHLYTLGRSVDLPDRSLKQIELFEPVLNVPCEKKLLFDNSARRFWGSEPFTNASYPLPPSQDIEVRISFENEKKHDLGIPLPRGRVRVSQEDEADGSLEFIGEDQIDHTPRNETVDLKIGNAFDVVGERKQADFNWSKGDRWMEETIEVTLRNQKETPVTVEVREPLYRWSNWEIRDASNKHEKLDASTIAFMVTIAPEEEKVIRYTAHYSW